MSIMRLSHAEIRVPDLELATAYYTEVLGLYDVCIGLYVEASTGTS